MRKFCFLGVLSILFLSGPQAGADQYLENEIRTVDMLRSQAVQSQLLGKYNAALGKYQQAIESAKRVFGENAPYLGEIYFDMGSLCLDSKDDVNFNKAEEYFNQVLRLNPNSAAAHQRLAELKLLQSHPDEAARHSIAILSKHRDDVVAHKELARAYENRDDNIRAFREYSAVEQLIQLNRDIYDGKPLAAGIVLPLVAPRADTAVRKPEQVAKPEVEKVKKPDKSKKEDAQAIAKKMEKEAEAKNQAEAARKKSEQESKRKSEQEARKKAEARKKEQEEARRKAEKKAAEHKKPAVEKKAPPGKTPDSTFASDPANLKAKAVLLTPVKSKPAAESKPAPETRKPTTETTHEDEAAPVKKPAVKKEKPPEEAKPVTPKPGKHAPGLVPPPPPIVPTFVMPPPQAVPPPKPRPQPKKEVKEPAATKEEKVNPDEEGEFLLDWGGAKGKKKK
jgi:hypothetical protein